MPKIHSDHRRRKNGSSREQWEKRKAELNAARGPQEITRLESGRVIQKRA